MFVVSIRVSISIGIDKQYLFLSPRRPVFMSRVKPKVDVVVVFTVVTDTAVVFLNAFYVMSFHCLCHKSAVYLTVPLSR